MLNATFSGIFNQSMWSWKLMETCNWKGLLCGKAFNACFFGKSLSSICFSLARVPLTAKQTTFLPFCVPWSDTDHRLARTIVLSRNYSIILRGAWRKGEKVGLKLLSFTYFTHSGWKSQEKSHSTLRAKRAKLTFWVDKSWLKTPKIVIFGEFLKCDILVFFKQCDYLWPPH